MSHAPVPTSHVRIAPPSAPIAILWAGAAAIAPTLIRLAVDHVASDITVFPAYFPFVMAAGTFLGWRSAVVAAILSGLAANYMFLGARFEFSTALPDIISTLIFLAAAAAVIVGVEMLKSDARATDLDRGSSRAGGTASPPLARGPGLLLATVLTLATWAAVIWGGVRAVRLFV